MVVLEALQVTCLLLVPELGGLRHSGYSRDVGCLLEQDAAITKLGHVW